MRTYYTQNNTFGGINLVLEDKAPKGHVPITHAEAMALLSAPIGTTRDANGIHVPPPQPTGQYAADLERIAAYRKSKGLK